MVSKLGISIPASELQKIYSHGETTYPEECCGVLIGESNSDTILEARPMKNTNIGSKNTRYNIDPFDLIKLDDELEVVNKVMVGIYHSHPNHPALPSDTDLKFAWPNLSYLVLSVKDGKADKITSWKLKINGSEKVFVEESLNTE